ncbi:MAG: V-type ATPase subunit [Candidatus Micrarchaeia archaeon]|jgi:V/A-type H+-transporting ATPase subunit C
MRKLKTTNQAQGGMEDFLPFMKTLTYGYSNARVRAMRPHLLTRRQADDLLRVNTNAGVIEYLSRTAYKNDFSNMPRRTTDEERVEIGVSRNFARTAQKLLKITPAKGRPMVAAFLGRYDVHNIKTIMLAKKLGKAREDTQAMLVPAGSMAPKELNAMLSAKSADDFYTALRGTAFGEKFFISASMRNIPKEQIKALFQNPNSDAAKLDMFMSALDFYYYEMASNIMATGEKEAQVIVTLLSFEADAKNIMTILRLKRGGADRKTIMTHMVGGGRVSRARLERIAAGKDVHESAQLSSVFFMSKTGRDDFAAAEQLYRKDSQLSHFEVVFERSIARRSLHALKRSIMSIGAIVGFLFLKEEEMHNIQKIVRGKALSLPAEKVSQMLIFA